MKVRVYAPPVFCDTGAVDEDGFMELPEEATLRDVYRHLKINPLLRRVLICTVNHKWGKLSQKLKDRDTVSFFSPVAGG